MSDEQAPEGPRGRPQGESLWGRGPARLWAEAWPVVVMVAVLWVLFALQTVGQARGLGDLIFGLGAVSRDGVAQGFWWTPLTNIFLHLGLVHIAFNSAALVALGPPVAQRFGRDGLGGLLFLGFFLVCGLASAGLFLLIGPKDALAFGASGAIFGLWGAVARLKGPGEAELAPIFSKTVARQAGAAIVSNLLVLALGTAYGVVSQQGVLLISWEGHLGGFLAGLLLIQVMPVRFHWLYEWPPMR